MPASDDGRFKDAVSLLSSTFNVNSIWSDKTDTNKLEGLTNPMPESTRGAFRTPTLRGVALTAPYMHSGQLSTLSDVLDFYAAGGTADTAPGELQAFTLTPAEKADLIAFLEAITGEGVPPGLLSDTSAP